MGYTHYWHLGACSPAEVEDIAADAKAIILASELPIRGWDGSGEPELGPTRIRFNGDAASGTDYETFAFPDSSGFCKTGREPYDVVVTAVLLAARDRLGSSLVLESDGGPANWVAGHTLAERALGRSIEPFRG